MYSARLTLFAGIAGIILLALPAANIATRAYLGGALLPAEPRDLLSLDRIEGNLAYLAMTQLGRSLFPERVQIGREGYLFFGDDDGAAMAKTRGAWPVPEGLIAAQAAALGRLAERMEARGARFLAVIAPNKHSVYPEMLPEDVAPAARTVTDDLLEAAGDVPLLDLRPVLRAAKTETQAYLKTDTHWTRAGAAASYEAVMDRLGARAVAYDLTPVPAPAGDLARLLKMGGFYPEDAETDYLIDFAEPPGTCTVDIGLVSGKESACLPAPYPEQSVMEKVMRAARTPQAPNPQTVLMLCDSFCSVSSPLFNASFEEVYRVHWKFIDDAALERHLARIAPNIVILQMVERDALSLGLGRP
ncbi:alginate O-acetyltransferase AlgX-related protein [Roseovarius aquimarinus]|uniref:AlgX/AlgJ SGNH hydrolase-like domain-containing protein n=1 Tax=Roseovarius aquimarinus TaxID=1229156 RepID=A0ABW7I8U1_9RHOB